MEELPYVIIITIVLISSWVDYRKKAKQANNEEDKRKAFALLLLAVVLFLISLAVFLT